MAPDRPPPAGLLPPDGVPWPPEPPEPAAEPVAPDSLPTTARRPADAVIADWRSMPVDAPEGYRGSASAPPPPASAYDLWSVAAIVFAVCGAVPWSYPLPLGPVLAIGFGLVGRRVCGIDPTRRGKGLATAAIAIGAVTLAVVVALVVRGSLSLVVG